LGKEDTGFGVRKMRKFNIALLEKWCWCIEGGCGIGCC